MTIFMIIPQERDGASTETQTVNATPAEQDEEAGEKRRPSMFAPHAQVVFRFCVLDLFWMIVGP